MKGIGRSILYWGYMLEKMFLYMAAVIGAVIVILSLAGGVTTFKEVISNAASYLVMIAVLMIFSGALNNGNIYLPLSVSLGSQRKKSFCGMQIIQHLIVVQVLAMLLLIYYYAEAAVFDLLKEFLPSAVGAFLLLLMIGNLVSAACIKFGRTWGTVLYIGTFLIIWGLIVFALFISDGQMQNREQILALLKSPVLLIAGLLGDLASMLGAYAVIRKNEIEFN